MRRVSRLIAGVGAALVAVPALGACGSSPAEPVAAAPTPVPTTAVPTGTTTPAPAPTTSPPPVTTTIETTTAAATTTLVDVPFERNESYYFTSPDGRFTCGIVQLPSRTEAGCEGVTAPVPPRPDDCMVSWGNGIRVEDTGRGAFMCSGGQVYTSGTGTDPVLPPGTPLTELGYTCETTASSVTCTNDATGHGFTIAPDTNETF